MSRNTLIGAYRSRQSRPHTLLDSSSCAGIHPIYLVFDHDLTVLVGNILRRISDLRNTILATNGVTHRDFGQCSRSPPGTVPVTIKSLVVQF